MENSITYKILFKEKLSETVVRMKISAAHVVANAKAGQFVVIIPVEKGERVPLTIAGCDKDNGILTIIFQEVGFSTRQLGSLGIGENIFAVLGPLGKSTHVEKVGTVVCVGGGVGIAEMLPVVDVFKKGGNRVIGIIGARTKGLVILENELKNICDEVLVATDDGSYGSKGFVTDILERTIEKEKPGLVYAVGPVPMMRSVALMTKGPGIKTVVSLNPVMVDATGMCGVCRCRVEGKTVFGCVDGPEFDAHKIDFDELIKRLSFFKEEEKRIQ